MTRRMIIRYWYCIIYLCLQNKIHEAGCMHELEVGDNIERVALLALYSKQYWRDPDTMEAQ